MVLLLFILLLLLLLLLLLPRVLLESSLPSHPASNVLDSSPSVWLAGPGGQLTLDLGCRRTVNLVTVVNSRLGDRATRLVR